MRWQTLFVKRTLTLGSCCCAILREADGDTLSFLPQELI